MHDTSSGKLGVRAKEARWVSFDTESKGARIYWPDKRTVTAERNVRYGASQTPGVLTDDPELEGESVPGDKLKSSASVPSETEKPEESDVEQESMDMPTEPPKPTETPTPAAKLRHSARLQKPSQYVRDVLAGKSAEKSLPKGVRGPDKDSASPDAKAEMVKEILGVAIAAEMADAEGLELRSLEEAKRRPDWPRWEEAMQEELRALEGHGTWRLKKPPAGANIVSCRWVFATKKDSDGHVYCYRARLVARGFS